MKKSELRQIIKEEVDKMLNEERDAVMIAKQIVDKGLHKGKSEKELYGVIFDEVFNNPLLGNMNRNRTQNIVWGDEDFISDVLQSIDDYKN
jgi:hypothetical protein